MVPALVHRLAVLAVVLVSAVLVTGTVVTGTGPHSGDAGNSAEISLRATRLDLKIPEVARVHGITVMIFLGCVVLLLAVLVRTHTSQLLYKRVTLLLGVLVAQAAVGYIQYFNDVPRGLVALHVAGATATFAATLGVLLGCPRGVAARSGRGGARARRRAGLSVVAGHFGGVCPGFDALFPRCVVDGDQDLTLRARILGGRSPTTERCRRHRESPSRVAPWWGCWRPRRGSPA